MAKPNTSEIIEALASEIGESVYIDVAKWHLHLSDAHIHTVLAEQLYPILHSNSLDESSVMQILQNTPVKIGGGRKEIALVDLLPLQCQVNLMDILEKYQNKL